MSEGMDTGLMIMEDEERKEKESQERDSPLGKQ